VKLPSPPPFEAIPSRDYMLEGRAARNKQSTNLVDLRFQRAAAINEGKDWGDLIIIAQALLICGLPYVPTTDRQITLRYRLAGDRVEVTFTCCDPNIAMPFGADRNLLHWLINKAIRSETPFISWETACEFLKDMDLTDSGKNFKDLRLRFERISALAITIIRERAEGEKNRIIVPIVEESNLPSSVDMKTKKNGLERIEGLVPKFGFTLNHRFWKEVKQHNVPVPWELFKRNRRKSILVDCMLFLYRRSYAAAKPSVIPWAGIEEQSASQDSNPWRRRENFEKAFRAIRLIDSNFPGETTDAGVLVIPYTDFLPGGSKRKTFKAVK